MVRLAWMIGAGVCVCVQRNHKGPCKGRREAGEPVRGDVKTEAEVGAMPLLAPKMEEGATAEECRGL